MLGANLRIFVSEWVASKVGDGFPYGTLLVNVTGSLLLGFFLAFISERALTDARLRYLVAAGFLGGYTTFSTYTFDSVALMLNGHLLAGLTNLLGSSVLGVLAIVAGIALARQF